MILRITILIAMFLPLMLQGQKYDITSPDNKLQVVVEIKDGKANYSISYQGKTVLDPSAIGMIFSNGKGIALQDADISGIKKRSEQEIIKTPLSRAANIDVAWNEIDIKFKNRSGIIFRVYNQGVAYRFYTNFTKSDTLFIKNELAEFNFDKDYNAWVPYSPRPATPFCMSFQKDYVYAPLSQFRKDNYAFLPLTVDLENGLKITITEADLEAYPGMFTGINTQKNGYGIKGFFAAYPKTFEIHPIRCQKKVVEREDYIAKTNGNRAYPWRIIAVTSDDRELPVNPLVFALASPNRIGDISWIKPGKIAWDWWNDWGISGVDFKVGINTVTYKYFIDFAAENGIEYVVLDEGWSNPAKGDIMSVIEDINLKEIIDYGKTKNVDIVIWAVLNVLDNKLEEACRHYSQMGIKGFKVDFLDRDDQDGVEMVYRVAEMAAKYKMIIDLHGSYKPTGFGRTLPNIINVEGVYGLEELKWSNPDMPLYDVTMPFIRMMCGPVDYTQGAMRNAVKKDFRDIYNSPMSQGTRAHQIATYIVFDSPLVTLCDSPTAYKANQECTDFIKSLPVVFDETRILQGKIGEYIITARRVGENWYIGGLTNWTKRDIEIPLDFLSGEYAADILQDGINSAKTANDYKIVKHKANNKTILKLHMAPGGGFAIKLHPVI